MQELWWSSIIIFTVLGIRQTQGSYDPGDLNVYIDYLQGAFYIGWTTLIPAILIIALLMFRVGAFEALGIGAVWNIGFYYFAVAKPAQSDLSG